MKITIERPILKGVITLPVSKSLYQRHALLRSIHQLPIPDLPVQSIEDIQVLMDVLRKPEKEIWDCKDSGTGARFLLIYSVLQSRPIVLTGSPRLQERPMMPLIQSLRSLGADISCVQKEGYLPLKVNPKPLEGGEVYVDASQSSQFISALMILGSRLPSGLLIELTNSSASQSYIEMTASILSHYGIEVDMPEELGEGSVIRVKSGKAEDSGPLEIEGDWSAASFWYEAAALSEEADILLTNLNPFSLQGDSILPDIFDVLGIQTEFTDEGVRLKKGGLPETDVLELDLSSTPDLFPPLAAVAAGMGLKSEFSGISHLQFKESNRIEAMREELDKIGVVLHKEGDIVLFEKSHNKKQTERLIEFSSHGDHRIVMALAPLALKFGQVWINGHTHVQKSYPSFWLDFRNTAKYSFLEEEA